MSDDVRIYLIAQTSIRLIVDISFMILFIIRICKLDKMASNNFHSKPKLMKFKIIFIVILQIIFVLHIILAYTTAPYWMNPYQNFSLLAIFQIIMSLLQIYIIRKQHKKKAIRAASVSFIWILWLLFDLATIIFVEVQIPSTSIILLIFQAMVEVALIVIGYLLQQKTQLKQEFLNTVNNPLIYETRINNTTASEYGSQIHDPNKIYIEFNKQFNVTTKNNKIFCQFKFIVYYGEQSHIITRRQEEFQHLVAQMKNTFSQSKDIELQQNRKQSFNNIKRYGQQKQKVYQAYLIKITQNQKYYTTFLLDFLEISPSNRMKLTKKRQKHIFSAVKKDSFPNQEQQKAIKPFFKVEQINNKIHVSNPQILEVVLNKSKSEIQKFHNRLIGEKKLKMQLLNEDPDINQLVHFIYRIVNSKNLWRSFSEWMVLGKQIEQKIYHMFDFWNYGFKNIKISIIGYQIAFDKLGSIHNLYLVSLSQNKSSNPHDQYSHIILKQDVTLKKRFNDFVKLDKNIKKFISQNECKNQSVMSLPPKFSPFGAKTSPKSRQIYLDMYLNQVLKIQNINHCIKFLEFLQIDLGRYKEQFHTIDQQKLVGQHISSMVIDQIQQNL